jgi:hypothetical protein
VPLLSKRQGQMCQVEETRANIQLEIKIEAIIQITILFMTFDEQTQHMEYRISTFLWMKVVAFMSGKTSYRKFMTIDEQTQHMEYRISTFLCMKVVTFMSGKTSSRKERAIYFRK